MDLRSGILSTAQALGVNPLDLATAISYETAGTFDPTKRGPTTQWGQHRGLIQFGEPQAQKYGVDWNNPIGSQLGPQGAVANYLRDTGVKPGMGLLDIYSAINAGGVGRYNRTDANNGGAPGTVRDKVEQQMAGHRRKAAALLGTQDIADDTMTALGKPPMQGILSTNSPQTEAPMQDQRATGLLGSLFPNMTADRQDRLAVALSGLSMHPNQGIVQMAGQRMADRREDSKAAQAKAQEQQQTNRTIAWLETQAQNNPNAAQALQMLSQGVIDARGALQLAMQKPEKPSYTWNETLGGYVDTNNPQAGVVTVPGAANGTANLSKDQFSTLDKLSDDATRDLKVSEEIRGSYNRILAFSKGQSVSDVALVTAYAKLLDPGSVVREGEAATIANSGSLPDAFKQSMLNALTGQGRLPDEVKQEIVSTARRLYYDVASDARDTIQSYQDRATRAGIGSERVYLGSDFTSPAQPQSSLRPQTRGTPQQPTPQPAAPTGNAPTAEQLKAAISQLSPYDVQLMRSIPGVQAQVQFLRDRGLLP